jgi:hypothetical protein
VLERESIIRQLEHLIHEIKGSETDTDIRNALKDTMFRDLFRDREFDYRLRQIERSIEVMSRWGEHQCRFKNVDDEVVVKLMIASGTDERNVGIKHLKDWIGSSTALTIADPYFLRNTRSTTILQYADSITDLLPVSLKCLELFVGPKVVKYQKPAIVTWFNELCVTRGIKLSVYHQEHLHDRVWINDAKKPLVVGTSFNGLGNKCTFLLALDDSDTLRFNQELAHIRETVECKDEA